MNAEAALFFATNIPTGRNHHRVQHAQEVHRLMSNERAQIIALSSIDAEYRFGRPKIYLTPIELARLTLLRSHLGDTGAERAAEEM